MINRKRNMILLKVLDRAHDDQLNMREYLNKSIVEICKQENVSPHRVFSILFCLYHNSWFVVFSYHKPKIKNVFLVIGYTV